MADFAVQDNETFLLIGDSITDCGRRGAEAPLGNGYVRLFTERVTARYPERMIRYANKGVGGNKITDLKQRWQDDVIRQRPDWLSIKIGITDANSHLRGQGRRGLLDPVSPGIFAAVYDELLDWTRRELECPIVLLTPFYLSTDTSGRTRRSEVLALLPEYIETVVRMSEKYGTRLVRLHDIFQEHLKYRETDTFCAEPVHPNQAGHMVIADALFETMHG